MSQEHGVYQLDRKGVSMISEYDIKERAIRKGITNREAFYELEVQDLKSLLEQAETFEQAKPALIELFNIIERMI
jgi:hypothetical protein